MLITNASVLLAFTRPTFLIIEVIKKEHALAPEFKTVTIDGTT